MTEDDKERRVVRGRPPRSTPQEPPEKLATGSSNFGRTLPEGVAAALRSMEQPIQRDETASVPFGDQTFTVEHRYGLVVIVLPDGTRVTGTPEQAGELANVLVRSTKR